MKQLVQGSAGEASKDRIRGQNHNERGKNNVSERERAPPGLAICRGKWREGLVSTLSFLYSYKSPVSVCKHVYNSHWCVHMDILIRKNQLDVYM